MTTRKLELLFLAAGFLTGTLLMAGLWTVVWFMPSPPAVSSPAKVYPKVYPLKGIVQDEHGQPVGGARIVAGDVDTTSDELGRFQLSLDSPAEVYVRVIADGFEGYAENMTPGGTREAVVILTRKATGVTK